MGKWRKSGACSTFVLIEFWNAVVVVNTDRSRLWLSDELARFPAGNQDDFQP
jgi:hypothetical protein